MRALFFVSIVSLALHATCLHAQEATDALPDEASGFLTEDRQKLRPEAVIEQKLKSIDADKRKKLDSLCSDAKPVGTKTHALIELCAWIGQHR